MFTIDLLKGRGLPVKSKPILVAIAAVPLLIPLMTAAVMAICCIQNKVMIQTREEIIQDSRQKITAFADDLAHFSSVNKQIAEYQNRLNLVGKAMSYRLQLSPFFAAITTNLPGSLAVTQLNLTRSEQQKKETDQKTGKTIYLPAIQRKLKIIVGGVGNTTTDQAAQQYVQSLSNSESLAEWFSDVQIVSRSNGDIDGRNCAFYEIECTLKEQK